MAVAVAVALVVAVGGAPAASAVAVVVVASLVTTSDCKATHQHLQVDPRRIGATYRERHTARVGRHGDPPTRTIEKHK